MVNDLNLMLIKYDITEPEQIYHFLSQVMKESDSWYETGRGDGLIEIGSDDYIISNYAHRTNIGNGTNDNYSGESDALAFRGSGY